MSDFYMPSYDDVDVEGHNVPAEGWQDTTILAFAATHTKSSGALMVVVEMVIDNGPDASHKLLEYCVLGTAKLFGETKLKAICEAAGFRWEQRPTFEAFVAQFPKNRLRVGVLVQHVYSIKRNGEWEDVPQKVWEAFEGDKMLKAQPNDSYNPTETYRAPNAAGQLRTGVGTDVPTPAQALYGDPAPAEGAPDEKLPF